MRRPRFTIARMMGMVLIAAVGAVLYRAPISCQAGLIFLATTAALALAVVAAIERRGARQAWWLGFAVFGWGHLASAILAIRPMPGPWTATARRLFQLRLDLAPLTSIRPPGSWPEHAHVSIQIAHALWTLAAACAGGAIAWLVFARRPDPSDDPDPTPMGRLRIRIPDLILPALILACGVVAIRSGPDGDAWAGATFWLTGILVGLAGLRAILGDGPRRRAVLAAALFGAVYLLLVFGRGPYQAINSTARPARSFYQPMPTSFLLNDLRPWAVGMVGRRPSREALATRALDRPTGSEIPPSGLLVDILKAIHESTVAPDGPGLPIYLDPIGLQEAERTPKSTIEIDLMGVPLRTTLRLALEQLGLRYGVSGGCLRVTSSGSDTDPQAQDPGGNVVVYSERWNSPGGGKLEADAEDAYLIAGHCLLTVLAMALGAFAAPRVAGAAEGRASG